MSDAIDVHGPLEARIRWGSASRRVAFRRVQGFSPCLPLHKIESKFICQSIPYLCSCNERNNINRKMGLFQSKPKPVPLPKALELCFSVPIAKSVFVLVKAGVPDIIERHGGSMNIEDITREAGFKDVDLAFRLLRSAEAIGMFSLDRKTKKWSNTESTMMLLRDAPGSAATLIRHIMYESYLGYTHLDDAVLKESKKTGGSSFEMFSGGKPYWEWLDAPGEEDTISNFNSLMVDFTKRELPAILQSFDWKNLGDDIRLLDIGGGKGHLVKAIIDEKVNTMVKPMVLDTPHMIEDAKQFWKDHQGKHEVSLITGDFFKSIPEADVYVLKHIIHDWNDEKSIEILKNVHKSASAVKDSTVLIMEYVLEDDKPLNIHDAFLDIQMLAMVDGKERTESQWKHIVEASGFKIDKIHAVDGAKISIIQASCA